MARTFDLTLTHPTQLRKQMRSREWWIVLSAVWIVIGLASSWVSTIALVVYGAGAPIMGAWIYHNIMMLMVEREILDRCIKTGLTSATEEDY